MIDPAKRAELDQAQAALAEYLPSLWNDACIREGFSEEQALVLVKTYILSGIIIS
jgi:hypothetical protein